MESSKLLHCSHWKLLIDQGFFDEFFPQLVNACFHFLGSETKNSFSLKDLIQKGHFVLNRLCIDIEQDSNFAIMDIFRTFDRSGRGSVSMLEFVVGIMEKLGALKKNSGLLGDIADELLSSVTTGGSPPSSSSPSVMSRSVTLEDMLERMQRPDAGNELPRFSTHLRALCQYIRSRLRTSATEGKRRGGSGRSGYGVRARSPEPEPTISKPFLVRLFQQSIEQGILEVQKFFHISSSYLGRIFLDHSSGSSSIGGGSGGSASGGLLVGCATTSTASASEEDVADSIFTAAPVSPMVWNLTRIMHRAYGSSLENRNLSSNGNAVALDRKTLLGQSSPAGVGDGAGAGSGSSHKSAGRGLADQGGSHLDDSTDALLKYFESDGVASPATDRGIGSRRLLDGSADSSAPEFQSTTSADDLYQLLDLTAGSPSIRGGRADGMSLKDLLNPATASTQKLDESHIFLLQTAFRTIDNFFSVGQQQQAHPQQHPSHGNNPGADEIEGLSQGLLMYPSRARRGETYGTSGDGNTVVSNELVTFAKPELGAVLFQTQEDLRRQKMRMEMLEMLQSQIIGSEIAEREQQGGKGVVRGEGSAEGEDEDSVHEGGDGGGTAGGRTAGNGGSKIRRKRKEGSTLSEDSRFTYDFSSPSDAQLDLNDDDILGMNSGEAGARGGNAGCSGTSNSSHSFECIMEELTVLKACLAERATEDFPLGYLLEKKVAVLDVSAASSDSFIMNTMMGSSSLNGVSIPGATSGATAAAAAALSAPGAGAGVGVGVGVGTAPEPKLNSTGVSGTGVSATLSAATAAENRAIERSAMETSSSREGEFDVGTSFSDSVLMSAIRELHNSCTKIATAVRSRAEVQEGQESILRTLSSQETQLAELRTLVEQSEIERNDFMSMSIELQILREKNQRNVKEEVVQKKLSNKNYELCRYVRELEAKLQRIQERGDFAASDEENEARVHLQEQQKAAEKRDQTLHHDIQVSTLKIENERLSKENQRLKSAVKVSEQRVMGALQDQMTLHHQLQQMEEEAVGAKANITKMTREFEELKIARTFKEESDRRIRELQREISRKELELAEIRESASLSLKYQAELAAAEKVIENLENKLGECSIELERGSVALSQLDNYREQIRVKTKENRDMSLHIHALESQLKDVPYLQNRFMEVNDELQDCKQKMEKIPAVLSEMARLRGSSRASVKALTEQDKQLVQLKNRVKMLEKEGAILRNDNRSMQDVENKLKDSNQEISRLMTMLGEMSAMKSGGVRVPEDDKKAYEGQFKKMRKFLRPGAEMNQIGGAGNVGKQGNLGIANSAMGYANVGSSTSAAVSSAPFSGSSSSAAGSTSSSFFGGGSNNNSGGNGSSGSNSGGGGEELMRSNNGSKKGDSTLTSAAGRGGSPREGGASGSESAAESVLSTKSADSMDGRSVRDSVVISAGATASSVVNSGGAGGAGADDIGGQAAPGEAGADSAGSGSDSGTAGEAGDEGGNGGATTAPRSAPTGGVKMPMADLFKAPR